MAKMKYKASCAKCGRTLEAEFEFSPIGGSEGHFDDKDIMAAVCNCPKRKGR